MKELVKQFKKKDTKVGRNYERRAYSKRNYYSLYLFFNMSQIENVKYCWGGIYKKEKLKLKGENNQWARFSQ